MQSNHLLSKKYWNTFSISDSDIDFIYNFLLEKEIPQSTQNIIEALIDHRIALEEENKHQITNNNEKFYFPRETYLEGDVLRFPSLDNQSGEVKTVRDGINPDIDSFSVIQIEFDDGSKKDFSCGISDHPLNHIFDLPENDPNYDPVQIQKNHGENLKMILEDKLKENEDLVKIAGNWFPRSLLVDINIGYLNLAEAILEESNGGPIGTLPLMEQVELNAKADKKLLEFSFDLALQDDDRFDEVGAAGETLWFLNALEPEFVQHTPVYLQSDVKPVEDDNIIALLKLFESTIYDELEEKDYQSNGNHGATVSLSFPHWRAGTLPLTQTLSAMFPTAYEAPRVKFTFVDDDEMFPGWVVRTKKYVYGLEEWYQKNDILPGSLINIEKGLNPGEIKIQFEKSRQNKEWLKTVLVGTDNGVVFAMLKQPINAAFNDRMSLVVPDIEALDKIWQQEVFDSEPIARTVNRILRELIKLNPQGQVHAQEIYASVNVVRRCPPSSILKVLVDDPDIEYLGDLYFKFREKGL